MLIREHEAYAKLGLGDSTRLDPFVGSMPVHTLPDNYLLLLTNQLCFLAFFWPSRPG